MARAAAKSWPDPGKNWPESVGMAMAQRRAIELLGAIAMVRETRAYAGGAKLCEVGHANMDGPVPSGLRPMQVLGAGVSWARAFGAAEAALSDPAVRAEAERHDELLAAVVAQRRATQAEDAKLEGHEEDA